MMEIFHHARVRTSFDLSALEATYIKTTKLNLSKLTVRNLGPSIKFRAAAHIQLKIHDIAANACVYHRKTEEMQKRRISPQNRRNAKTAHITAKQKKCKNGAYQRKTEEMQKRRISMQNRRNAKTAYINAKQKKCKNGVYQRKTEEMQKRICRQNV